MQVEHFIDCRVVTVELHLRGINHGKGFRDAGHAAVIRLCRVAEIGCRGIGDHRYQRPLEGQVHSFCAFRGKGHFQTGGRAFGRCGHGELRACFAHNVFFCKGLCRETHARCRGADGNVAGEVHAVHGDGLCAGSALHDGAEVEAGGRKGDLRRGCHGLLFKQALPRVCHAQHTNLIAYAVA